MNIFEHAMTMEKEGEEYYRQISRDSTNMGLSNIFDWMADEEAAHYKIFEAMKNDTSPDVQETTILSDAKGQFLKMQEGDMDAKVAHDQTDAYKKSLGMEQQAIDYYTEKANEVKAPSQKEVLLKIADEEKKHYFLLENLIEFISKPEAWVEHAEFNHLDEYYE